MTTRRALLGTLPLTMLTASALTYVALAPVAQPTVPSGSPRCATQTCVDQQTLAEAQAYIDQQTDVLSAKYGCQREHRIDAMPSKVLVHDVGTTWVKPTTFAKAWSVNTDADKTNDVVVDAFCYRSAA